MATSNPKRGEVWLVDLDPTRGQEIKKKRPVVVLSADPIGSTGAAHNNPPHRLQTKLRQVSVVRSTDKELTKRSSERSRRMHFRSSVCPWNGSFTDWEL